jgi:hypothetical protein
MSAEATGGAGHGNQAAQEDMQASFGSGGGGGILSDAFGGLGDLIIDIVSDVIGDIAGGDDPGAAGGGGGYRGDDDGGKIDVSYGGGYEPGYPGARKEDDY